MGSVWACCSVSRALALSLRRAAPGDQIMAGPADGHVSAIHFNPAALRLSSAAISWRLGRAATLGSYGRDTPLPAGFDPGQAGRKLPIRWRWAGPCPT